MKLLLKLRYNGGNYAGYQAQADYPSVQETLTGAVSDCFGRRCTVTGCSRTDAGVHALGFVAAVEPYGEHEENWLTVPVGKVHRALSKFLPDDISVCGEAAADDDFHPRYSVKRKTYVYRMYDTPYADPFLEGRAWHLKRPLTDAMIARMNEAAEAIVGRHDFTSLMAAGSKITDAEREVYSLSVGRKPDGTVELSVTADGFLYNMVRIITGTLVDTAYGTTEPGEIAGIIASRDRTKAGRTAPAGGLYLADVEYDREIGWIIE